MIGAAKINIQDCVSSWSLAPLHYPELHHSYYCRTAAILKSVSAATQQMTQNQQSSLLNGENGVSFLMSCTDWTKEREKRNLLHTLERKTLEKHSNGNGRPITNCTKCSKPVKFQGGRTIQAGTKGVQQVKGSCTHELCSHRRKCYCLPRILTNHARLHQLLLNSISREKK